MSVGNSPNAGDGRNIDRTIGALSGEAATQRVPEHRAEAEGTTPHGLWRQIPSRNGASGLSPTYYERPAIKGPVWKPTIAAYFFVGGAAGAAAVLGAAAQLADRRGMDGLVRRCRWLAVGGSSLGGALLIGDLGRPGRFLNMLRVVRPTSPMSVGSWILAGAGSFGTPAAMLAHAAGPLRALGDGMGLVTGLFGGPLAGYTGVLVGNTVVPVWEQTRRSLPPLFVASGGSSAASILTMMRLTRPEQRLVQRFGLVSQLADVLASAAVDREASRTVRRVGDPLRQGVSGGLWKASRSLTLASVAASLVPGSSPRKRRLQGALGVAGSLAMRFAIYYAGIASARDPRATFELQRAGGGAAETTRLAAVAGAHGRGAADGQVSPAA